MKPLILLLGIILLSGANAAYAATPSRHHLSYFGNGESDRLLSGWWLNQSLLFPETSDFTRSSTNPCTFAPPDRGSPDRRGEPDTGNGGGTR
jgi:hypothetical protein